MTYLSIVSRRHIPTVAEAIKALTALQRQIEAAKTYDEIRKTMQTAEALKLLFRDIDLVKSRAEDTILAACARIGEELQRIPKATNLPQSGKLSRAAAMPSGSTRARFKQFAEAKQELPAIAAKLRANGHDATPTAVLREINGTDKSQRRAEREQALAEATRAASIELGKQLFDVLYADPPWRLEPYSRETGLDRAADNHYPTLPLDELCQIIPPAARDCTLFLWATVPMLTQALKLIEAWNFTYKSHCVWIKSRIGTGYWFRNAHELLLVATRGNPPAPAPGEQYSSVIEGPPTTHSAKPPAVAEMIEDMFPNAARLEMFARAPRLGWNVWGNEVAS